MTESILLCPECGEPCTHIVRAWSLQGCDPNESEGQPQNGELYGIPVGGTSSERRGALVIEVHGECGHCFEIHLQQRKGQTFVSTRLLDRTPDWCES